MASRKSRGSVSVQLESVRRRFERWRRTRTVGTRIPEALWEAATKAARIHGIHRTASTLRVDYYSLQKRVEKDRSGSPSVEKHEPDSMATFVELPLPQPNLGECILELEDADGAKMRVHLKNVASPDLAALTRSFWGYES